MLCSLYDSVACRMYVTVVYVLYDCLIQPDAVGRASCLSHLMPMVTICVNYTHSIHIQLFAPFT